MPQYLLGTDNGATVAKAALFTVDGREVAVASRKTDMVSPHPGHTERDAQRVWQATAESIREVLARAQVPADEIACVASTGHGNGLYLVDQQGCPVRGGIISTDTRAKDYVARWQQQGVAQAVLPTTMQCLWPGQPTALLAWLRDHEPQPLRQARWALMCKDYIRFRLTGQIHAELTDMSVAGLINVATGDYDPSLLEAFGLAELSHLMPPIQRSEDLCAQVSAQAAAETGLAEGTPVAGGMCDIDACALASGIVDESQMCLIAGTWSINEYISRTPVVHPDAFMCARYCIPGYYLVPEASATSASNLEWFATEFLAAEQSAAREQGRSVYEVCNELVATTHPTDSRVIFLPFLFGSNADPRAKACWIGLGAWHGRADVLRALYEGVVFGHKAHVDRLLRFRTPPQSIRLTGGATRSDAWVKIFADVFQLPVEIPAGTELGALGTAISAAVAVGCYADYHQAVRAMVRLARKQDPDPGHRDVYAAKYDRYQKAIAVLVPLWSELE